jgi:photosynthetic reaction center cytochrome c subunit
MKFGRRAISCGMGTVILCLLVIASAFGQAAKSADPKPQMSEEAFKNIQVLRGIPVNEFMGTMGFFAASLGLNCTDCHTEESAGNWAKYADDTPLKNTARRMVIMMNAINRSDFGATRLVTCYTCHRGVQKPEVTPSLAEQNATPPPEDPDRVEVLPGSQDNPAVAEQIIDKFIQAIGGAQALAKINSFTAKGTYTGFDTDFQKVPVEIFAKSPNQLSVNIKMSGGDHTTTYDGREGWVASADRPLPLIMLVGGDLDGARLDARISFPATLKQDLTKLRANFPPVSIDDKAMQVVAGVAPNGSTVKLFFDKQTGLLTRQVRYVETAVGITPVHVEYSDYRAVSGVKMPYHQVLTWTDGNSITELSEIQANAQVAAAKFAKPNPVASR